MSDEKRRKSIVKDGDVRVKRDSGHEIAKMFIKNDAKTVADSIVYDHVLPGFMDMVIDGLHSTIDLFLGSGGRSSRGSSTRSYNSYYREPRTSYRSYYDDDRRSRREERETRVADNHRGSFRMKEIIFNNKGRAREVLDTMVQDIAEYNWCRVSDYYEYCDQPRDYTAKAMGWESLRGVEVIQLRDGGYVIDLPNPIYDPRR